MAKSKLLLVFVFALLFSCFGENEIPTDKNDDSISINEEQMDTLEENLSENQNNDLDEIDNADEVDFIINDPLKKVAMVEKVAAATKKKMTKPPMKKSKSRVMSRSRTGKKGGKMPSRSRMAKPSASTTRKSRPAMPSRSRMTKPSASRMTKPSASRMTKPSASRTRMSRPGATKSRTRPRARSPSRRLITGTRRLGVTASRSRSRRKNNNPNITPQFVPGSGNTETFSLGAGTTTIGLTTGPFIPSTGNALTFNLQQPFYFNPGTGYTRTATTGAITGEPAEAMTQFQILRELLEKRRRLLKLKRQ